MSKLSFAEEVNNLTELSGLSEEVCALVLSEFDVSEDSFQLILNRIDSQSGKIAIQNDDLPLLRDTSTMIAALLAGAAFNAWAPITIAGLIHLLFLFRKKKIEISALQACIVRELTRSQGLTVEEIREAIFLPEVTKQQVEEALIQLQSLSKADGTLAVLVREISGSRWVAVDL